MHMHVYPYPYACTTCACDEASLAGCVCMHLAVKPVLVGEYACVQASKHPPEPYFTPLPLPLPLKPSEPSPWTPLTPPPEPL